MINDKVEALLYGMQFRHLLHKTYEPVLEKYKLQRIDLLILLYLDGADSHDTAADIMKMEMFTRGHVSQSLGRLSRKGLITAVRDAKDRRCYHNLMTGDSSLIVEEVKDSASQVKKVLFEGMTEEEIRTFVILSKKILDNIEKAV